MKTITMTLAFALAAMLAFAGNGDEKGTTMKVDAAKSSVSWKGKKVTGEHHGAITIKEGTLTVEKGMIETAVISIDMTSITVLDEGMDDGTKGKLKGHLESDDFFSVEKHNTATFQLTSFKPAQGTSGNNYMITGKLTIKGKTNEISFPAKVTMEDGMVRAEASLSFDRSNWDIRYGSGSFFDGLGDKMIYDDVEIDFVLVANS